MTGTTDALSSTLGSSSGATTALLAGTAATADSATLSSLATNSSHTLADSSLAQLSGTSQTLLQLANAATSSLAAALILASGHALLHAAELLLQHHLGSAVAALSTTDLDLQSSAASSLVLTVRSANAAAMFLAHAIAALADGLSAATNLSTDSANAATASAAASAVLAGSQSLSPLFQGTNATSDALLQSKHLSLQHATSDPDGATTQTASAAADATSSAAELADTASNLLGRSALALDRFASSQTQSPLAERSLATSDTSLQSSLSLGHTASSATLSADLLLQDAAALHARAATLAGALVDLHAKDGATDLAAQTSGASAALADQAVKKLLGLVERLAGHGLDLLGVLSLAPGRPAALQLLGQTLLNAARSLSQTANATTHSLASPAGLTDQTALHTLQSANLAATASLGLALAALNVQLLDADRTAAAVGGQTLLNVLQLVGVADTLGHLAHLLAADLAGLSASTTSSSATSSALALALDSLKDADNLLADSLLALGALALTGANSQSHASHLEAGNATDPAVGTASHNSQSVMGVAATTSNSLGLLSQHLKLGKVLGRLGGHSNLPLRVSDLDQLAHSAGTATAAMLVRLDAFHGVASAGNVDAGQTAGPAGHGLASVQAQPQLGDVLAQMTTSVQASSLSAGLARRLLGQSVARGGRRSSHRPHASVQSAALNAANLSRNALATLSRSLFQVRAQATDASTLSTTAATFLGDSSLGPTQTSSERAATLARARLHSDRQTLDSLSIGAVQRGTSSQLHASNALFVALAGRHLFLQRSIPAAARSLVGLFDHHRRRNVLDDAGLGFEFLSFITRVGSGERCCNDKQ
jgi:hypothetical protein